MDLINVKSHCWTRIHTDSSAGWTTLSLSEPNVVEPPTTRALLHVTPENGPGPGGHDVPPGRLCRHEARRQDALLWRLRRAHRRSLARQPLPSFVMRGRERGLVLRRQRGGGGGEFYLIFCVKESSFVVDTRHSRTFFC